MAGKDHLVLLQGRIYADTGDFVYRDSSLSIETTFGLVTDIGTQFAVELQADRLEVAAVLLPVLFVRDARELENGKDDDQNA